jgi:hypothetical protein
MAADFFFDIVAQLFLSRIALFFLSSPIETEFLAAGDEEVVRDHLPRSLLSRLGLWFVWFSTVVHVPVEDSAATAAPASSGGTPG